MTTFTDPFASSTEIPVVEVIAFDRSQELQRRVRYVVGSGVRGKQLRDALARAIGDVVGAVGCAVVRQGRQGPQYAGGCVAKQRITVATPTWREPQPAERAWFAASARLPGSALPTPSTAPWSAALVTPIHDGTATQIGALILVRHAPGFAPQDERLLALIAPDLAAACARPTRRAPLAATNAPQDAALASTRPTAPQDAFLEDVAHKLRNHLNSIHGFVELVATGHAGPIAPRQSELLSYAHASSIELMQYIENLLLLTRSAGGHTGMNLDTVYLHNLVEEAAQYLELEATVAHVQLRCDAPATLPAVVGDHLRLRQALMNLITNAIKYTEPHGTIRLAATALPAALELTVTDSGIGIASEDVPHIFTRGYQSQRTGRLGKNGGGLGLAAAHAIISQHGGTLTCASTVGRGATFTIHLPHTP